MIDKYFCVTSEEVLDRAIVSVRDQVVDYLSNIDEREIPSKLNLELVKMSWDYFYFQGKFKPGYLFRLTEEK